MSIASEITRLQNAKASLKTSINAKNDNSHQITTETLEDYASFVDEIPTGGGGGHDWSAIGYSEEPNQSKEDYLYAKNIYDNWDATQTNLQDAFLDDYKIRYIPLIDTSNATTMRRMFQNCIALTELPLINTSNVTIMYRMFNACTSLKKIALIDTSNVTNMSDMFLNCKNLEEVPILNTRSVTLCSGMFSNCPKLTDESLNNILEMCISASLYPGSKTLYALGLRGADYPVSKIESLSSYQDFLNAGWTIGY